MTTSPPRFALALAAAAAGLAAFAAPAAAHDFWIVPSQPVAPTARDAVLSLFVGEDFVAEEEKPFDASKVRSFRHFFGSPQIGEDVMARGAAGEKPMARIPLLGEGGHLIAMDRRPTNIELSAEKFEGYLHHEGLDSLVARRVELGESKQVGRERYSRYLKTLVQIGDRRDDSYATVTGAVLELVPEQNPVFLADGDMLSVRVLFRGQPLPNARLEAFSRQGGDVRGAIIAADIEGRARVPIDRRGLWLLRMVHMIRCEGCSDADWESFWTSYSFATMPAPTSGGEARLVVAPSMFPPAAPHWPLILAAGAGAAALALGGAMWRRRVLARGA